jgi:hypothetical protein
MRVLRRSLLGSVALGPFGLSAAVQPVFGPRSTGTAGGATPVGPVAASGAGTAPSFTSRPTISGFTGPNGWPKVGDTLTVHFTAAGSPAPTATIQWFSGFFWPYGLGDVNHVVGTGNSYTLQPSDLGNSIAVYVTLHNGVGSPVGTGTGNFDYPRVTARNAQTVITGATITHNGTPAVQSTGTFAQLVARLRSGDMLTVPAGYFAGGGMAANVTVPCTIAGQGMGVTTLDMAGNGVDFGIITPHVPGITIQDLTLRGTHSTDNNASGHPRSWRQYRLYRAAGRSHPMRHGPDGVPVAHRGRLLLPE